MDITVEKVDYSKLEEHKNSLTKIVFQFINFRISLVNSIRRCLLSEIPNVGFCPKNTSIIENTSVAHNEFIKHRISLLPINRHNLKIKSCWNKEKNKREYDFINPVIPMFELNTKNNKYSDLHTEINIKDIMTNEFKIYEGFPIKNDINNFPDDLYESLITQEGNIRDYFKTDLFTGDDIHFLVLKTNPYDNEKSEKLRLLAKPNIGMAKIHSSYSPVGNVSYNFVKEKPKIIDYVFSKKIIQINKERNLKDLANLNETQINKLKKSFDLLDSQRVYKKNKKGECNCVNLGIESIGVIQPNQALYDSLIVLNTKLIDLLKFIVIKKDNLRIIGNKIKLDKKNLGKFEITIFDEEHTLGNLLTDYLNKLTLEDVGLDKQINIFEYVSYKVVHPLKNILIIQSKLNKHMSSEGGKDLLSYFGILNLNEKNIYLVLLIKCIEKIIKQIVLIKDKLDKAQEDCAELKNEQIVRNSSFEVEDSEYEELPHIERESEDEEEDEEGEEEDDEKSEEEGEEEEDEKSEEEGEEEEDEKSEEEGEEEDEKSEEEDGEDEDDEDEEDEEESEE